MYSVCCVTQSALPTAMRALSASCAFRACVVIGSDVVPRNKLCRPHLACVLCGVMFLGKGLAT